MVSKHKHKKSTNIPTAVYLTIYYSFNTKLTLVAAQTEGGDVTPYKLILISVAGSGDGDGACYTRVCVCVSGGRCAWR